MKAKLVTLVLLSLLVTCQAQVLVYKATQTCRSTGSGGNLALTRTGSIVFNSQMDQATAVMVYTLNRTKCFQVESHSFTVSHPIGPNDTAWTALYEFKQTTNSVGSFYVLGYGKDAVLTVNSAQVLTAPKTISAKPQQISYNSGGDTSVWDTVLTLTFDPKSTKAANLAQQSVSALASVLRASYLSKGYTELQPLD
jgi:hypothetical protein